MFKYNNITIEIIKGDITKIECDVIVNAANKTLLGGGGVDGAIHRAGGSEILEECRKLGGCETGEAKITTAGRLKAKYVVHTVGPVYKKNEDRSELLYNAYYNSMKLADKYNAKSIAFPAISTGVYGYPKLEALDIAVKSVKDYTKINKNIEKIIFVLFSENDYRLYCSKHK